MSQSQGPGSIGEGTQKGRALRVALVRPSEQQGIPLLVGRAVRGVEGGGGGHVKARPGSPAVPSGRSPSGRTPKGTPRAPSTSSSSPAAGRRRPRRATDPCPVRRSTPGLDLGSRPPTLLGLRCRCEWVLPLLLLLPLSQGTPDLFDHREVRGVLKDLAPEVEETPVSVEPHVARWTGPGGLRRSPRTRVESPLV